MKNIQIIDGAINTMYDIFAATDEEFRAIFPEDQDIAFIDEVYKHNPKEDLDAIFEKIWTRRLIKREVNGIHGLLFYGLPEKKAFYPTRKDEEAINPDGSRTR